MFGAYCLGRYIKKAHQILNKIEVIIGYQRSNVTVICKKNPTRWPTSEKYVSVVPFQFSAFQDLMRKK